ncbi:MAG: DEAD/DEAH box helicase family protein [Janthinobacterium lividum]
MGHYQILVSRGEGKNVTETLTNLVQELLQELGQASLPLCDAVEDLVHRIDRGQFVIRGAWETQNHYRFHCKFYILDDECMWSGSANFTKPGLSPTGNEEQANLSRNSSEIQMFSKHYDKTIAKSDDLLQALYGCLKTWLGMATPFDAYLKVLHYWYGQEKFEVGPRGHNPTYFQTAIVTHAVQQIRDYKGALLLIATGLGKTIIGAETARQVTNPYLYKKIIILAPTSLRKQWHDEIDSRFLRYDYFDNSLLFRNKSDGPSHQITQLLEALTLCDETTILIVDESHRYRNILRTDASLRRQNRSSTKTKLNLAKERIGEAMEKGANPLLLTATPYGTDM